MRHRQHSLDKILGKKAYNLLKKCIFIVLNCIIICYGGIMQIEGKNKDGDLYIFLSGEIDQSKAIEVRLRFNSLLSTRPLNKVILNMGGLQFVDSTFLGVLLARYKQLREQGVPIFIEQPSRQIDKLLNVSGIYSIIPKVR